MKSQEFRAQLVKLMPGYDWTVHKTHSDVLVNATGIQSSGSNRLSTLSVIRTEREGLINFEVRSAGYGVRAKFLETNEDNTLAKALRGLQDRYQDTATTYKNHADALEKGRQKKGGAQ